MTATISEYDLRVLVCPADHASLSEVQGGLRCRACGAVYRVVDDIVVFETDESWDRLYLTDETHYKSEDPFALPPGHEGYLPLRGDRNFGLVLDAGCGDGVYASGAPEGTPVYCVDVTLTGLRRLVKRGRRDLRPVSASILRLPFVAGTFDTVLCIFVIEHLAKGRDLAVLSELRRVVADDGRVLLTTDTPFFDRHVVNWTSLIFRGKPKRQDHVTETGHINLLTMDEARRLCRDAGFAIVREEPYWMGDRFRSWRLVSRALRGLLPRRVAENYLTSSYTLVLTRPGRRRSECAIRDSRR